ncbi:MAG: DUF6063 family protein [Candidatus Eremiobacterota bacterium]
MFVDLENVKLGARIFFRLIEKGEINSSDDRDLMKLIDNDDIKHILSALEEETGTIILHGRDRKYISARTDNKVFGYTNSELRKELHITDNEELYTCYFIILSILALFYRGEGYDMKYREFLEIEELYEFIDVKIDNFKQLQDLHELEEAMDMKFSSVVNKWDSLMIHDERKKNLKKSENSRMAYISKVLKFLCDEKLLMVEDGRIIRTSEKMDSMVTVYYTAKERKKEILDFINQAG